MSNAIEAITTIVGAVVGFMVAGPIGALIGAGIGYGSADLINSIINPGFDVPDSGFDQATNQNQGVLVNKQGTNLTIPVIYGTRRVGGSRVFVSTEGENNKYLHIVLAIAEGEIEGYTEIYCDDILAWSGTSAQGQRYEANQGKYRGVVTFETYHGTSAQNSPPLTIGVGGWSNQHRLRGLAYIAFRLTWVKVESAEDQDETPWSSIPTITVVCKGKKIANAANFDDTVARSVAYADETVAFNNNPINCLLDYLRNPLYGKGLSNDQINFKSFRDENIRWGKLQDGQTIANPDQFHECNAVIFTDRTLFDNTRTMLFNMRSALPYQSGRFAVRVEDNRQDDSIYGTTSTPVMTVGEDSIIGTLNLESDNVKGKYNRVNVTYMGGRQDTQLTNEAVEITYPEPDSALAAQYLAEDDNRLNEMKFTLEHVTQDSVALKYAQVAIAKSRYRNKIVTFIGDASLHQLQVNDIFTLVYSGLGINGEFRVKSIQFNGDYTFSIVAEEHNDLIYGGNVIPYRRRTPTLGSIGNYPIYIDKDGVVHHIGNKSDAPLGYDWVAPPDLNPVYNNPQLPGYTQEEIEAAMESGLLIGIVNGDIILADPEFLPVPEILSATVSPSVYGHSQVDVRLFFTATDEPNVDFTQLLQFFPRENAYFQVAIGNQDTAARDGYIELQALNPSRPLNCKLQFVGKQRQLKTTSDAFTVDFTGFIPNNIIFEEL